MTQSEQYQIALKLLVECAVELTPLYGEYELAERVKYFIRFGELPCKETTPPTT